MKTYKQFISECYRIQENVQGGMLRFGYKPGRGASVGASLQGGTKNTQWDAGIDYERIAAGRVATPQTIERGVAQASQNVGQTADTSDAVGPQNRIGVTANVAGTINPQAPKPKPKPKPQEPEKPEKVQEPGEPKEPEITVDNYRHADPVVDAKLRRDPKLLARAVELANRNPKGTFYNSGIVGGNPLNARQAQMTSQARQMAGANAVAGSSFTYGDASHKNDRQAHNAQYKAWQASR